MGDRLAIRLTEVAPFPLGAISVAPAARTLTANGRELLLEPRVMQVLVALNQRRGEVVGRDTLIDACWDGRAVGEDAINRAILKLRRALAEIGIGVAIDTVAKVGYRLAVTPGSVIDPAVENAPRRSRTRNRWYIGAGIATACVGFAGTALVVHARHVAPQGRVVAVEPMRTITTDAPATQLAQDFASDLSRAVLGHDDRLEFSDLQSANEIPAAFTVGGSVSTVGRDLHAVVTVKKRYEATLLWSHDYTAPLADAGGLRQQVGVNVAAVLVCALGTEGVPEQMDAKTTALYLETCALHAGDHRRELGLLRQITVRAPRFAGAWADLAISLAFIIKDEHDGAASAMRQEAEGAATRALSLDPHLGRAYFARALLMPGFSHWIERRQIIAEGLAAQPDCPQLYNIQAVDFADIGRERDSIASDRRAVELDPLFPGKTATLARALSNAGRLDEANEVIHRMEVTWPDSFYTWHAKFEAAARIGNPLEAEAMLDHVDEPTFDKREVIGWRTFLKAREAPTPRNIQVAINRLLADRALSQVNDTQLISDFALLGKSQLALKVALQMPPQPNGDFWFREFLRPVRADPLFMTVAKRQGLYQIWRETGLWPDFCLDRALDYDCHRSE